MPHASCGSRLAGPCYQNGAAKCCRQSPGSQVLFLVVVRPRHSRRRQQKQLLTQAASDYVATASDASVLQRPLKEELHHHEVRKVFGFASNLKDKYTTGKVIGAGSFGIVREVTDRKTNRKYACKTIPKIPKRGKGTPRYLLKIQQEVDAMMQIGPSLDAVFLADVYEDDKHVHLVMELCTGGGILDRIEDHNYTERRIAQIMRSVIRFIAQCHAKGIIYRDIKPDNFLFLNKNPNSPIRATDFGLSIRYWSEEGKLKSRSGTPVYMAPEVILQDYDERADVWSVGMLMYQLLTGTFPFWDSVANISLQQAILVKKLDLESNHIRDAMSEDARDLLKKLLVREPEERLTAFEALEHKWVQEGGSAEDLPLGGSVVQRLQRFATYGLLKQVVLKMIADELQDASADDTGSVTTNMVITLRDLFTNLDKDKSNSISSEEMVDGLRSQGYDVSQEEVERLMGRIDFDKNGNIDFEEFTTGLLDWRALQKDGEWAKWVDLAFSKLDTNDDGYIDLEELIAQLPGMGVGVDERRDSDRLLAARRMLREADANGDGLVSKHEFVGLLSETNVPDGLGQYDARLKHEAEERKALSPTPR